jgi:two-component system, sensor histidine kinase and response regulator
VTHNKQANIMNTTTEPAMTEVRTLNILVVDDVPQNLLAMQAMLWGEDRNLLLAESGPAALELLLKHEVALALLDVQMPGMDGFALAELMRGTERTRHVPIIFLTAASTEASWSFRGYEAGAVDFYKPLDARILQSKVGVFLELARKQGALERHSAELERLSRANALMLGALSHDIRTPLAALQLNAELISRRAEQPAVLQAGQRMKAATTLLQRHVEHLINLARQPVQPLHPVPQPVQMHERIVPLADALRQQGIDLMLESEGDTQAEIDPLLMPQALEQLLTVCALHADGAPLHLLLDGQSPQALTLRLFFNRALPESVRQRLFGEDQPATSGNAPLAGSALDRATLIVRAHGGSLIGRSQEGRGTHFELLLPRQSR